MTPVWNAGMIAWPQVDQGSNVVQVQAAPTDPSVTIYWWRNLLPGENAYQAFTQFCRQFPFPTYCVNVVAAVGQEWTPDAKTIVWSPAFSFTEDEINLPMGE